MCLGFVGFGFFLVLFIQLAPTVSLAMSFDILLIGCGQKDEPCFLFLVLKLLPDNTEIKKHRIKQGHNE